ncbi:MAG: CsbD family protein [Terriglobales bacterium]
MDNDKLKGKGKDITGRLERQVGEWTGDEEAQAEGAKKQVEGKVQNTWGKMKDKARDIREDIERKEKVEEEEKIKRPRRAA